MIFSIKWWSKLNVALLLFAGINTEIRSHHGANHDDVIKWKDFPRNWPFVRGIHPVPGEYPAQRPVTRSFGVFFDLRLNKRLSKQSRGWWFETLPCPLWRHGNDRRCGGSGGCRCGNPRCRYRRQSRCFEHSWLLVVWLTHTHGWMHIVIQADMRTCACEYIFTFTSVHANMRLCTLETPL